MSNLKPKYTVTDRIAAALTEIERARGFLEATVLSNDWVQRMANRALLLEAHHTTHKAIQDVREQDMDLTGWLEFFVTGLEIQMKEVKELGKKVIKIDLLVREHGLNDRQSKVLIACVDDKGEGVSDLVDKLPDIPRRTLQRDLARLVEMRLLTASGHTNRKRYVLNASIL